MKPIKEDRKKFDIDLSYGSIREDKIIDMFLNKKIEVKSEKNMGQDTGNICIEYESWGRPSGIKATEADYWFHNLCVGENEYCTLVFKTEVLRSIVNDLDTFKSVSGGDNKASKMFLINLQKLFSSDVIKAFKELDNEK